MNTVYSIGYSGFPIDGFIDVLKAHGVTVLVDVRSSPYSGYFADYNREALAAALKRNGIHYRNYARQFGARQEDRSFYTAEGYLDFARFAASPQFAEGVEKVCSGMELGYVFAFMCAEKDPMTCHRAILVTREFARRGFGVIHLLPGGETQTQADLDARLLDRYFPGREQLSLFGGAPDESDLLDEAYRMQNAAIGYRIGEENR